MVPGPHMKNVLGDVGMCWHGGPRSSGRCKMTTAHCAQPRETAKSLGADPERRIVGGDSAGSCAAAFVGLKCRNAKVTLSTFLFTFVCRISTLIHGDHWQSCNSYFAYHRCHLWRVSLETGDRPRR